MDITLTRIVIWAVTFVIGFLVGYYLWR